MFTVVLCMYIWELRLHSDLHAFECVHVDDWGLCSYTCITTLYMLSCWFLIPPVQPIVQYAVWLWLPCYCSVTMIVLSPIWLTFSDPNFNIHLFRSYFDHGELAVCSSTSDKLEVTGWVARCTQVQAWRDDGESRYATGMVATTSVPKLETNSMGTLQETRSHWTQSAQAAVWQICRWYVVMFCGTMFCVYNCHSPFVC